MPRLLPLCLVILCLVWPCPAANAEEPSEAIDRLLQAAWSANGVQPAAACSNEQFLRRATLDLAGRIPTVAEHAAFLARPDRAALIDQLLASDEFSRFWADLWTTQLYGYQDEVGGREALSQWLETQLQARRPYDQIVLELITARGESAFNGPVNFLVRHPEQPVVKVSRAFLGVRLDCARCHDHPFDRWTRDDFQRMDRFFEATERQEVSAGNVRLLDVVRQVDASERPRFLSGAEPKTSQWRAEFGLFLTRSRPFARNFANRIWYHLLGRGIVHPVDDVSRENPAAVPELLEWLAEEARRSDFDIRHLLRGICLSQAYQLQSVSQRGEEPQQKHFAVRSIKPLTPEQWYASMCVATGRVAQPEERTEFVRRFYGDALDGDFSASWEYRETAQGLMARLVERVELPPGDTSELFVRFLGRQPSPKELAACATRSATEIGFVLLHSSEFAFNH